MMTAKEQILKALTKKEGATLTVAQAQARFGIVNVRARISDLRKDGYNIVSKTKMRKDGTKSYFYQIEQPVQKTTMKGKKS